LDSPRSCAFRSAIASYSRRFAATSSGMPIAWNWLAATRPAIVAPMHVNTGKPISSASFAVVPAW
jgi:hypothetical protein